MKKMIVSVLAAAMALSLCACGSGEKPSDAASDSSVSTQENNADAVQDSQAEQENNQRDALMTYQVEINGTSITIPCEYEKLTALGYTLPEDEELNANTYTIGTYVKNAEGDSMHVQFWNGSTETKKYSECEVCQIEIKLSEKLDVTLPGGIKFDESLTPEQVIEAYGEADFDLDQDDYRALDYEDGGFKKIDFMFYKEDNMKGYTTLTINHIND